MTAIPPASLTASKQVAIREAWLAQVTEAILEPGLPIIDPHHHLWDHPGERYLFDDLRTDVGTGHDIRGTVFIQCGAMYRAAGPEAEKPLGETEFVNGVAAMSATGKYGPARLCDGIVGMVDLTLGDAAAAVLEKHVAAADGRFKGVRNRTAWHPSPEIRSNLVTPPPGPLEHPDFITGAKALARMGLTLDVWAYHTQLPLVLAMAKQLPEATIILDHCGGPLGTGPFRGKREEVFPVWRDSVRAIAALPNVTVKLGGLAMHVNGFDFQDQPLPPTSQQMADAWRPYMETCIEAFGASRCMFESNFPVDKGMCSYAVLWNAFKRLAAGASETERSALFSGTAARVYGMTI